MISTRTPDRTFRHALAEAARQRLQNTSYRRIRGLTCECDDRGMLYLRGRLSSYYQKQLAQEAVAGLPGLAGIINQAEVVDGFPTIVSVANVSGRAAAPYMP
ncbi:MAG: BON domain-containing protein [Pirellulaceae bacterium]